MNSLYYGDNLEILRKHIETESVDLIYLDPPFNSQRAYNVIFQDKTGKASSAQIQAFEDTWAWTNETQQVYEQIMLRTEASAELKAMMQAFRSFMGNSDLMAYLTMMAIRLVELHRVLKPTGSLYLHCDPTASHYLKLLLDQIFGISNFRNEIIWKRTSAHSSANKCGSIHDVILFYSRTDKCIWNDIYQKYDSSYLETFFDTVDEDGRHYKRSDLTGAGVSQGVSGQPWKGLDVTTRGRHWMYIPSTLDELDKQGRIHWPKKKGGMPRLKQFPEDLPGVPLQDIWDDIRPIHNLAQERLGYPTQKPVALLERILTTSSKQSDVVLDPFCGCGTAIVAAEKLGRKWIGIDITHLAISLIKKRLNDHFPDSKFAVVGEPKSVDAAEMLFLDSPFQFESWAVSLLGGQPFKSKGGGDGGIDGLLYFQDFENKFHRAIIEVKGGKYQPKDIRALKGVLEREEAPLGILIALQPPTKPMLAEAAAMGTWTLPGGSNFPIMQIVTIEQLFGGRLPKLPDTSTTLKKAKREYRESEKKPPKFL
ncbi:MAG: DNA methyltransferase [candidate division Zixibacteria bacterium]|nr:DNA methyltransferase [candidate division Zixibacteria bacterium]